MRSRADGVRIPFLPLVAVRPLLLVAVLFFGAAAPADARSPAWLGISVQDLNTDLKEAMGLPTQSGALVSEVVPGSPAERAGIRPRDVIVKIDEETIAEASDLVDAVNERKPGEKISVQISRDGAELRKVVTLASQTAGAAQEGERDRGLPPRSRPRDDSELGVRVYPIGPYLAPYFRTEPGKGVLVLEVYPGSPAMEAGLRPGDVILALDGEAVNEVQALRRRVREMRSGDPFTVDLLREGRETRLRGTMIASRSEAQPGWESGWPEEREEPESELPPQYGWNQRRETMWSHGQLQQIEREIEALGRKIDELGRRIERLAR